MGGVKKAFKSIGKPFEDALGSVKDTLVPEIDTSGQEEAARRAMEQQRRAAEQSAQQAKWQAEAAAQNQTTLQQREQLQRASEEDAPIDDEEADIRVGDTGSEARRRRKQFTASGTSSNSPSIRI